MRLTLLLAVLLLGGEEGGRIEAGEARWRWRGGPPAGGLLAHPQPWKGRGSKNGARPLPLSDTGAGVRCLIEAVAICGRSTFDLAEAKREEEFSCANWSSMCYASSESDQTGAPSTVAEIGILDLKFAMRDGKARVEAAPESRAERQAEKAVVLLF